MKVWIVQMICGACGDYEWGGVYSNEDSARIKQQEMKEYYFTPSVHQDCVECDEHEVED